MGLKKKDNCLNPQLAGKHTSAEKKLRGKVAFICLHWSQKLHYAKGHIKIKPIVITLKPNNYQKQAKNVTQKPCLCVVTTPCNRTTSQSKQGLNIQWSRNFFNW